MPVPLERSRPVVRIPDRHGYGASLIPHRDGAPVRPEKLPTILDRILGAITGRGF